MRGSLSGPVGTSSDSPRRPRAIVSGYTPTADASAISTNLRYLRWVTKLAAASKPAGSDPARNRTGSRPRRLRIPHEAEWVVASLHRAYSEFDGLPAGELLPEGPVVAELTQYTHGTPLTCLAGAPPRTAAPEATPSAPPALLTAQTLRGQSLRLDQAPLPGRSGSRGRGLLRRGRPDDPLPF